MRDASPDDHAVFAALFPELGVADPIPDRPRFAAELAPTSVVAVRGGETVGFGYFRLLGQTCHVVQLITAPTARRTGVGAALMNAIATRAAAAGCTTWYLNTVPTNHPAIALYTRLGFAPSFHSQAITVPWAIVDARPPAPESIEVRPFEPAEDATIEAACGLIRGQLTSARALGGRILRVLLSNGAFAGAACFDPTFPGAHPFRVSRPELALPLLAALRPHARTDDAIVHAVIEDRPDVGEALLSAGATLRLTTVRMSAPLPANR